ncbi:MAG: DUF1501 domain-containing protein [Planctomycetota bacterium]|nr:DUF1501 domain-containing protein [Planctomycetota bacterium]
MTHSGYWQTDISISGNQAIQRRQLLRLATGLGSASAISFPALLAQGANKLQRQGKSCILLWMQGGPSQFETFSPKPTHSNGGDTKAISTQAPGIQIAENLPQVSRVMQDICLIRSMNSKEGSHPRAQSLLHTGYLPTASVQFPTLGSHAAHQLGDPDDELPNFVRIGRAGRGGGGDGGGLLGVTYDPFVMSDASRMPENTTVTTSDRRYRRRLKLRNQLESQFAKRGARQEVANQKELYAKSSRMVLSPKMDAFDISQESKAMQSAYGDTAFGKGCLLARRLLESGVTFVEVVAGNWDTHFDNFSRSRTLCQQIDQPYAQLLQDLKQRGILEKTLVIWMGEFGRTPRINPRGGRDHFPRAFNVALSGSGIRGGQVIGRTNEPGTSVSDRPISVADLFQTFCQALDIDADHENLSGIGRPIKIVDGGVAVTEAFS